MKSIIISLLISLTILTSCSMRNDGTVSGEPKPLPQKPLSLEIVDIGSVNNGQAESGSLLFYADYPIFSGSHVSDHMRAWIQHEVDTATIEAKENQEYMPDLRPEFMASFTLHTGSVTTITYEVSKYIGGAHGMDIQKSFALDRFGNKVIFSDLFIDFTRDIPLIRQAMVRSAEDAPGSWGKADQEGLTVGDGIDEFLKDPNFYFSGSDLILMYQKYQIGPGSSGPIEVVFPEKNLLKSEIRGSARYEAIPETHVNQSGSGQAYIDWKLFDEAFAGEGVKYIALTFDDGPSKINTPVLLDTLRKYNAKATFYVLGKNVSYFPTLAKRTINEGHELGSHSWDHPQLTRLSGTDLLSQKSRTDAAIYQATGQYPATFRPPYGAFNAQVKSVFARPLILWSVDTLDWKYRNVSRNISVATSGASNGTIILFHDIHTTSVASIESIVKNLQAKGYEFITISDLLGKNGIKNTGTKVCSSGKSCK